MSESKAGFTVTLPSNASMGIHKTNKPQAFTVELSQPINLQGQWEAALMEIQYPNNWFNITDHTTLKFRLIVDTSKLSGEAKDKFVVKQFFVQIKALSVSSIPALLRILNQLIYAAFEKEYWREYSPVPKPCWFNYDEVTKKVSTEYDTAFTGGSLMSTKGSQIIHVLGYSKKANPELLLFDLTKSAEAEAALSTHYPAMFVYCDAMEHQVVGDTKAPLLRTVAITDKDAEVGHKVFQRPYYIPVSKNYISSLTIELRNDAGELITFQSGKVLAVLHFRRCGLAI